MTDIEETSKPPEEKELQFHYVKSNFFRVLHVTGAFGGLSPQLFIHMNVFGDRLPLPTLSTQKIDAIEGRSPEVIKEGKQGVIREVEADIVLDIETAKNLVVWLRDKINQAEMIVKKAIEEEAKIAGEGKTNGI